MAGPEIGEVGVDLVPAEGGRVTTGSRRIGLQVALGA